MLAAWVTSQIVFNGFVQGLVYGLLAMAIVLVYRSSKVINFAIGSMGLIGSGLLVLLTVQYGVPYWISLAIALVAGVVYGGDHRTRHRAPTLHRAPGDPAGGDHRRQPTQRGDPARLSRHRQRPRRVPAAVRARVLHRRSPDQAGTPRRDRRRARSSRSASAGSSTARCSDAPSEPRPSTLTSPGCGASTRRRSRRWCGRSAAVSPPWR